jgi:hypothetical protein
MLLNKLLLVKNWEYEQQLKVFVLAMPFFKLANMPLLMTISQTSQMIHASLYVKHL